MAAPFAALCILKYGRAISVQKLPMVIVVTHGRAICSFMHFKYGRAISVRKLLTVFIVMRGRAVCNLCDLKSPSYGRAILLTTLRTTAVSR